MTRILDPEEEWSITAKAAIGRYRHIEAESGVPFFTPAGFLGLCGPGLDYNERSEVWGRANGAALERLDAGGLRARFPFLAVADDADGLVETGTAGHISPRSLVAAQTVLAERAGADVVREFATKIRPTSNGVEVELSDGAKVEAERALVTTGAFTSACGLSPVDLGLTVFARTVVLARIEGDVAEALSGMPTMKHAASGAYILPPIPYPDGNTYLKIGIGTDGDRRLSSLHDLRSWFKSDGSADNRTDFIAVLEQLMPVLQQCTHWHTDTCAISTTRSGLPIIDFVDGDRIAVAVGGCGKGAKGSDEWGRIAAALVSGADHDSEVSLSKLALAASG